MHIIRGVVRSISRNRSGFGARWVLGRALVRNVSTLLDQDRLTISHINSLKLYQQQFSKDHETCKRIDQYIDLYQHQEVLRKENTVKIGILNSTNHKLIPSLLADPLAAGNNVWFEKIENRDTSGNNTFVYGEAVPEIDIHEQGESQEKSVFKLFKSKSKPSVEPVQDQLYDDENTYRIPSPILSPVYRPNYMETMNGALPEISNYIEITEINDVNQTNFDEFHFLMNIADDLKSNINDSSRLPRPVASKLLFTIIDNQEYSPPSTEDTPITFVPNESKLTHHVIKINSQLAYDGICKFLKYDTKASSEYVDSIRNSNIFEVVKAVGFYSRSDNLSKWIFDSIKSSIETTNVTSDSIQQYNGKFTKEEVIKFSNSVHEELQYDFIPNTTKFFKTKLVWWKLYFKNDNVEYDLKDFFNQKFMNKSIEEYNYLRGYIVLDLQQNEFAKYSDIPLDNPLLNLKIDVINNQLSAEVQPKVNSLLLQGFIYYQLPISVISFLSWQHFDFSTNAAVALALLGWVVGFNHVSKNWSEFSRAWTNELFEKVRLRLGKDCIDNGLLKELNFRVDEEVKVLELKNKILQELNRNE